jgi:hypothetical protein
MMSLSRARLSLVAALTVFAVSGPVNAQQPSPAAIATAKQLVELKGATRMFDILIPGIVESAKNSFLPTHPQLAKDLNEVADRLRAEFAPRRADIANEFATVYAQHFTEQEMKDVIAFFKTPIGQKFVAQEPAVMDQALSRTQTWSNDLSELVVKRFRAEMKKKGHDL